jgi:ribosomal protein S3AE
LKFVGDKTENYIRQIVWDTVHYRWEKYFFSYFASEIVNNSVRTEIHFATNLDCNFPT